MFVGFRLVGTHRLAYRPWLPIAIAPLMVRPLKPKGILRVVLFLNIARLANVLRDRPWSSAAPVAAF